MAKNDSTNLKIHQVFLLSIFIILNCCFAVHSLHLIDTHQFNAAIFKFLKNIAATNDVINVFAQAMVIIIYATELLILSILHWIVLLILIALFLITTRKIIKFLKQTSGSVLLRIIKKPHDSLIAIFTNSHPYTTIPLPDNDIDLAKSLKHPSTRLRLPADTLKKADRIIKLQERYRFAEKLSGTKPEDVVVETKKDSDFPPSDKNSS